jgi:AcrR family transcriptional regulator
MGRRERKKLATRQAIADRAMELFLARGFDRVTVAEIAEAADVAESTVFKHFDSKEAIAFAGSTAVEDALTAAVRDRAPGVSILGSLRAYLAEEPALAPGSTQFVALVRATPALTEYSDRLWSRRARVLAEAIEHETGLAATDIRLRAWTRYVVQIPSLVREEADREAAIGSICDLLANGWQPDAPR